MGAARDLRGAARHAAFAAGQAGAVAHELGAAAYAIKAARAAAPEGEGEAAGRLECQWQRDRLPAVIRELVLSLATLLAVSAPAPRLLRGVEVNEDDNRADVLRAFVAVPVTDSCAGTPSHQPVGCV